MPDSDAPAAAFSTAARAGFLILNPLVLPTRFHEEPKYKVALRKTDEGFSVSVPGLPGCWSQGATEAEAIQNIQDAIQEYLAARDELLEGAVVREVEVAS